MARSGWAAVVVTVVLVGILGTGAATERATDAEDGVRPLVESLTRFPAWNSDSIVGDGDLLPAIAAKVVVALAALFLLAFLAGRTESGTTAFLAGWGALVVACSVAGGVYYAVAELTAFDGDLADGSGGALSPLVREMNAGAVFALYTGWVVAAAVTVTRRTAPVAVVGATTGPDPAPVAEAASSSPPRQTGPTSRRQPQPQQPRSPIATWPPMPAQTGTVPPSPAWAPPRASSPLPAVTLPRRASTKPDAPARDRTASGLPRRPVPARGPKKSQPDSTKVHPGVPGPTPDQDPTTTPH